MTKINKIKHYLLEPRFHFNRIQFNALAMILMAVGLTTGMYLSLSGVIQRAFALNDTNHTWEFSTATSGNYTYDANLITVDNSGARLADNTNKITNPSFTTNTDSWTSSPIVPDNWIEVPGDDALYGTTNFLAMKYEAKAWNTATNQVVTDGGFSLANSWAGGTSQTTYRAKSTPDGRPWVRIAQDDANYDAIQACQDAWQQAGLPSGSTHLITNNEWMTIARNVEAQDSNWTNNEVGNGALYRGNSNSSASLDGSDPLTGINTRTLNLSNGAVIWDLAGNVWQWTDNTILGQNKPESGNAGAYVEWTAVSDFGTLSYNLTRPLGSTYNSVQGVGQYYMGPRTNNTTYAFLRGGSWLHSANAGAFTLALVNVPANQHTVIGFRCASDPVAISQSYQSMLGRTGGGLQTSVGNTTPAKIFQSINVGSADAFNFSAYIYDQTAGNEGGIVDSSVASLYYNGTALATTYTNAGSGWWRLSASLTGANEAREYGVQVASGKTVVVDDFTLTRAGEYSVLTTTAYTNNQVVTWDSFCEGTLTGSDCSGDGVSAPIGSSVVYQICTDDGSACESGDSWLYWNGATWASASNTTTHTNTAGQLTQAVMQALDTTSQKISVKAILGFEGASEPTITNLSVGLTTDTDPPVTNASNIVMKTHVAGRELTTGEFTDNPAPHYSWTAGADNPGGSGLKGYCLYLGTDPSGDPATSKGLLGTSPVSTTGSNCGFIINSTTIDFATLSHRGSPWLTSSVDSYYLNIKAIDNANLVFTGASTQFEFKYDDTLPTNVSYINPASGSFSNIADMNFSWPTSGAAGSSDDHSGVLGWQYSVNSQDDWKGSTTHPDLAVDYIPFAFEQPYYLSEAQDGANIIIGDNIIYFRTLDVAGNISAPSTYRTGSLSYGGAAPTFEGDAVVTVAPATSDTNNFALSWPAATPADGETIDKYYYMINTTPPSTLSTLTSNSATYIPTSSTSVPAGMLAGAQKGTNTVRVVAVDQSGNYSPSNLISGTFTLNSNNPDPAKNLTVSDASIKSVELWRASLAWDAPDYKGTGTLTYVVQRSQNSTDWTTVTTTSGTAYVDTVSDSKQYYWRVGTRDTSDDSVANPSFTNAVTLTPKGSFTEAANLTSGPVATEVTTRRAKIVWTTNRDSDSKVAFGTESGKYGKVEASSSDQVTSHEIELVNLSPGTTYYYKVRWTDEDGNTGESDEKSFSTAPAPRVTDPQLRQIGLDTAILEYTVTGASSVKIYYGRTTDFGAVREVSTSTAESTYTTELSDLLDGQQYYYKINTLDSEGHEYEGSTLSFETLPRPRISGVRLQQVANTAQTTILVSWETNTPTSAIVSYYPTSAPGQARDQVEVDLKTGPRQMIISGLLPQQGYSLVVRGRDRAGNEAVSDTQFFTTATDTRPPQISNLKVIGGTVPPVGFAAGEVRAQMIISWDTDEPATSQVEYGEGTGSNYPHRTQEDGNLTANHSVIISGLTPSKIYHFRAISKDAAGNESRSIDTVTVAPKATQSALDLVMGNLSEMFDFLKGLL